MKRTLFYTLLVLCGLLVFLTGQFSLFLVGFAQHGWAANLIAGAAAIFLCALWADRLSRVLIGPQETDYRRRLSELSRSLALIVDLDQLLEEEAGSLKETLRADGIAILLGDLEKARFPVRASRGYGSEAHSIAFGRKDRLIQWLEHNETPLVVAGNPGVLDFLTPQERTILDRFEVNLVAPLSAMNRLVGVLHMPC